MLDALGKTMGIISTAAQQAGIDRCTHYKWLKSDKAYKEAVEAIEERSIDFAESKLMQLISGVKLPETKAWVVTEKGKKKIIKETWEKHFEPDTTAVIFYLKTKGKKRGYVERVDHDITSGGKPVAAQAAIFEFVEIDPAKVKKSKK